MSNGKRKRIVVVGAIVAAVAIAGGAGFALREPLAAIAERIGALGPWTGPAFAAAIAAAVVLLVPTAAFTFGCGYFVGWIAGSGYVLAGMTLGSVASFALARRALRPLVRRAAARDARLARLEAVAAEEGWRVVFLIRLVPFFPSKAANYVFGLTPVRLVPYAIASFAGYVPNTLASVYAGSLAASLREAAASGASAGPARWIGPAAGLVALFALARVAARAARRAYEAEARAGAPPA